MSKNIDGSVLFKDINHELHTRSVRVSCNKSANLPLCGLNGVEVPNDVNGRLIVGLWTATLPAPGRFFWKFD